MPEGAVYVGRPTYWGNPFVGSHKPGSFTPEEAVDWFRHYVALSCVGDDAKRHLAGKDLACWCALDAPCHADVLLEIANA